MARSTPPAWFSVGILLVIVAFCCGISDVTDGLLLEATGRRTPGALLTAVVLAFPVIMLWRLLGARVRQAECEFGGAGRKKFHPEWTLATAQSVLRTAALPVLAHMVVSLDDTLTTYGWPTGDPSYPGLPRVIGLYVVLVLGLSVCCFPKWLGAACSLLPASVGYWLARLVGVGWTGPDPRSGSVIIVACNRRLSESEAPSLLAKVPLANGHPFAWLASAAVAANRGDIAAARLRFGLVAGLPDTPGCEPGRRLAREWLCTEALARGAWREAAEWAGPPSNRGALLQGLAAFAELGGARALTPMPLGVVLRLCLHGGFRLAGAYLLFGRQETHVPELSRGWQGELGVALARHQRALEGRRFEDVELACTAWAVVEGHPELRTWALHRASEVGAGGDVVGRLVAARISELSEVMWRQRWFRTGRGVLRRASDAALDRAWAELLDRARGLPHLSTLQPGTQDLVPSAEEAFLAWEPIRALASAIIRDRPELRAEVIAATWFGPLQFAVDAFNTRGFKYFGNVVFHSLLELGQDALTDAQRRLLVANGAAG